MKQENNKYYPFQFTNMTLVFMAIALLLCVACFAVTTWRFIGFLQTGDLSSTYSWLQFIILYLATVLLAILITAMLVRSQYVITDKQVIVQFGFIKTKYEIKGIFSIHLFKGSNRLALYFDDYHTKYTMVAVNPSWYDEFIKTLLAIKPSIEFSFSSADEETKK